MIKTFRGLLADGGQDRIRLSTIKGKVGYKIVKFQTMGEQPASVDQEATCKIYKVNQTTIDSTVDFSKSDLLGVAVWSSDGNMGIYPEDVNVIFDTEIINQDIYVTNAGTSGTEVNYYIEMEVMDLSEMSAEYTTLKDLRAQ